MIDIGFHEIGERFMYDGVMLEVMERTKDEDCEKCYFERVCSRRTHSYYNPFQCYFPFRDSNDSVYYKLVGQCKTDYTWGNTNSKIKILGGHVWTVREEERKEVNDGNVRLQFCRTAKK